MIRDNIKRLRGILSLSQKEFGQKLGVSRDMISNIEYGRAEPKLLFVEHICDVYGVNKDWLVNGTGEPLSFSAETPEMTEAFRLFSKLEPSVQERVLLLIKTVLEIQNRDY